MFQNINFQGHTETGTRTLRETTDGFQNKARSWDTPVYIQVPSCWSKHEIILYENSYDTGRSIEETRTYADRHTTESHLRLQSVGTHTSPA